MRLLLLYAVFLALGCTENAKQMSDETSYMQADSIQLAAPSMVSGDAFFKNETKVSFAPIQKGANIKYSFAGDNNRELQKEFLTITESGVLDFSTNHPEFLASEVEQVRFFKLPENSPIVEVTSAETAGGTYTANGVASLFDKKKGSTNFRDGKWLGYEGGQLQFDLKLKTASNSKKLIISSITDQNAWIFSPAEISLKDKNNNIIQTIDIPKANQHEATGFNYYEFDFPAGYEQVILTVKCLDAIPDWHGGKGSKPWFFIDEILAI